MSKGSSLGDQLNSNELIAAIAAVQAFISDNEPIRKSTGSNFNRISNSWSRKSWKLFNDISLDFKRNQWKRSLRT